MECLAEAMFLLRNQSNCMAISFVLSITVSWHVDEGNKNSYHIGLMEVN